jgi:hypothetical protein
VPQPLPVTFTSKPPAVAWNKTRNWLSWATGRSGSRPPGRLGVQKNGERLSIQAPIRTLYQTSNDHQEPSVSRVFAHWRRTRRMRCPVNGQAPGHPGLQALELSRQSSRSRACGPYDISMSCSDLSRMLSICSRISFGCIGSSPGYFSSAINWRNSSFCDRSKYLRASPAEAGSKVAAPR